MKQHFQFLSTFYSNIVCYFVTALLYISFQVKKWLKSFKKNITKSYSKSHNLRLHFQEIVYYVLKVLEAHIKKSVVVLVQISEQSLHTCTVNCTNLYHRHYFETNIHANQERLKW